MEHYLRQIVHDNRNPIEIRLHRNDITIGRGTLRELIPSGLVSGVSRSHARLTKVKEKWFIKDLSINGTYINQSKIKREEVKEIQVGDHIGLGVDHPSQGFVCALCIRPIEVIELDDSPPIEIEPLLNNQDSQSCTPQPVTGHLIPPNPAECSLLLESTKSNEQQLILTEDSAFPPNNQIHIVSSYCYNSKDSPHNQHVLQPSPSKSTRFSSNTSVVEVNEGNDERTLQNSYFPCQKVISSTPTIDNQSCTPQPVTGNHIPPNLATNPVECSLLLESTKSNEQQLILTEDSAFPPNNQIHIGSSYSKDSPHNQRVLQPSPSKSAQFSSNTSVVKVNEGNDERTLQNSYFPCQKVISSTPTIAVPSTSNVCTVYSELKKRALNATEDINYQSTEDDSEELRCDLKRGSINRKPLSESDSDELQFDARKKMRLSSDSDSTEDDVFYSQSEDVFEMNSDNDYYDFNLSQVVNKDELVDGEELGAISIDKSNQDKELVNLVQCSNLLNPSECRNSAITSNFSSHNEDSNESSIESAGNIGKLIEHSSFNKEEKDSSRSSCSSNEKTITPTKFKTNSQKYLKPKRKYCEESAPNLEDKGDKKKTSATRKPGKLSRNEKLALESQNPPNRPASKPSASCRKKSTQLSSLRNSLNKSSKTTSEVFLNKTIDSKKKRLSMRRNTNGTTNDGNNISAHDGNLSQPGVSNPEVSQDLGLNRANQPKPMSNLDPVYPAEDKFISDSMDAPEPQVPTTTNLYLSKYGPTVSKPVNSNKAQTGVSPSYSKDILIEKVVTLNTKWLEEQNKKAEFQQQRGQSVQVEPPSLVMKNTGKVPLSFNSLDEYVRAFSPLLMLEIWELMCDNWKNHQKTQKFYFVILKSHKYNSYQNAPTCTLREYECESIVNSMSFCPVRGSVVILDIEINHQVLSVFGFVHHHLIEESGSNNKVREAWKKCGAQQIKGGKMYKFKVLIKDRDFNITTQYLLMKGSGLCNIDAKVSLMDNFLHLSESPLCHYILSPNNKGIFMASSDVNPGRDEFNGDQMLAINTICTEINVEPKIVLLRCPPRAGKLQTIIGLLDKMVSSCSFRILVVAPSNEAIDEIGQRLILFIQQSQRGIVKFVTVGAPNLIGKALQPYTVDSKLKEVLDKELKSKGEEIQKYREEIAKLQKRKTFKAQNEIKKLEESISITTRVLSLHRKNPHTHRGNILKDSNVVLSTLSSCSQTLTSDSSPFSCVIVDEASEISELELLQIMSLKTSKLILIGDKKQLPATLLSSYAKQFGLERSMFERLHMCLTRKYPGIVS